MSATHRHVGRPKGAVNPRGLHDLGMLDLAEAAAELHAAHMERVHAERREARAFAHMARGYRRLAQGWARDHGDEEEPTTLAEAVGFTSDHLAAA